MGQVRATFKIVLPRVMYVVTSYTELSSSSFCGAPRYAFKAVVQINISSKEEAQSWLQQMMHHS